MGAAAIDMGAVAQQIGQGTLLTNGRADELESNELGVKFMLNTSYNPEELIGVMQVLKAAAGPNRVPEFQSNHPDPEKQNCKNKGSYYKIQKSALGTLLLTN